MPLAGAVSDGMSAARAAEEDVDIAEALARHRSGAAIAVLGDGIDTGPTYTNVNDLLAIAID
jgi:hydroxypyruvate reductase